MQRYTVQNRVCKALNLQFVDMRIRTEHAVVLVITHREAFYLTRTQIPGIGGFANDATILTVHLKAFVPVHAHRHRQVKVTNAAISEFGTDKPAVGSKLLN